MIPFVHAGQNCWLCTAAPNWAQGVSLELQMPSSLQASLTQRESRRSLAGSLRAVQGWSAFYDRTAAARLREALVAARDEIVIAPVWPAVRWLSQAADAPFTATLLLKWEPDFTQVELTAGTGVVGWVPTAQCRIAPVVAGRWREPAVCSVEHSDLAEWTFSLRDAVTWATQLVPVAEALTAGPAAAGVARPAWAHWWQPGAEVVGADSTVGLAEIGLGRVPARSYAPHAGRRAITGTLLLRAPEAARLALLFSSCRGSVVPWWAPARSTAALLAAPSSAMSAVVSVDRGVDVGASRAIVFIVDGQPAIFRRVLSRAGNDLTLDASPGVLPAGTRVQPLWLMRFDSDTLALSWDLTGQASAEVTCLEVQSEYDATAGETAGVTLGALERRAYLYEATDGLRVWRMTNWESDIATATGTFTARPIEHDRIQEEIDLQAHDMRIRCGLWADNPFAEWVDVVDFPPLEVSVWRCDPANANATRALIWKGLARSADWQGGSLDVIVGGPTRLMDIQVPRRIVQRSCSAALFDSQCGLDRAQWKFSARFFAATGSAPILYRMDTWSWRSGAALPAIGAGYFAGGYLERTVGGVRRRIGILNSTALTGGIVDLTLRGALDPFPAGVETWDVWPGCDGSWTSCATKFSNSGRFVGFPHMPVANPAFVPVKSDKAGAKK